MPVAQINVLKGHSKAQLRKLLVDVSDAVARVLNAPKDRLEIWINEVDPDLWGICGVPASEALQDSTMEEIEMPFVQMALMEGRTTEQYHQVISEVTDAVANATGATKARIRVHIDSVKPDLWGIGGVPAAVVRAKEIAARAQQTA
jgi:4-oxalocrotonate tautomerase family enzyme